MESLDLESQLLRDRVILVGSLDSLTAQRVRAELLHLEKVDPAAEIDLYVNCGKGALEPGLAVYDTMQLVRCPVATICVGAAGEAAVLVCAGGREGLRSALPQGRFMVRQPPSEFEAAGADADAVLEEARARRRQVADLLARHTRRDAGAWEAELRRGRFLGAAEAVEWGIIDLVVEQPPKGFRTILA